MWMLGSRGGYYRLRPKSNKMKYNLTKFKQLACIYISLIYCETRATTYVSVRLRLTSDLTHANHCVRLQTAATVCQLN